jgi:hypothetical protein
MPNPTPPEPSLAERLKDVAKRSGKPLEVVCARSFLQAPAIPYNLNEEKERWKVSPSSYYVDGLTEKIREIDVIARRQRFTAINDSGFNSSLEVFMSCKGFPPDEYPITFSTMQTVEMLLESPPVVSFSANLPTVTPSIGKDAANALLWFMCGRNSAKKAALPQTIGFDIIKDPRSPGKDWRALGDRTLFEGLDSALRAALYWKSLTFGPFHNQSERTLRVQVPVLVLSRPWHQFSIDSGSVEEAVETSLGFTANPYPAGGPGAIPTPLFTLLISADRLPDLQTALAEVYFQMWKWGEQAFGKA